MPDPLPMVELRISEQYPEAASLIRKYESVNQSGKPHLTPYKDIGGRWVAGYGRSINENEKDVLWTGDRSEEDLDVQILEGLKDIDRLEKELPEGFTFTRSEREALIPFMQNVGYSNLLGT